MGDSSEQKRKQESTQDRGHVKLDQTGFSREIRAIHDKNTIRVYQAYNDVIAESAVAANSFLGPLSEGLWSSTRMTWIKPSKVWMAYRCGWTFKDQNQKRVLALDLSRAHFENLMQEAVIHYSGQESKKFCNSNVVVQWDPERYMTCGKGACFTKNKKRIRSIQIGLRGSAINDFLLNDEVVLRITDVTNDFRGALYALQNGKMEEAEKMLWPGGDKEQVMTDLPETLKHVLQITT